MCRLLGSVTREAVTVDEVLGVGRRAFLDLSSLHADGWGHAWVEPTAAGRPAGVQVRKAPEVARESAELAAISGGQRAHASLTHLRLATLGLGVGEVNTHPFTDGSIAFAHNGSISPPAALDALVPAALAATRRGDTDSERLFLALLARLQDADPATALQSLVADVLALDVVVGSLNCLLLTPQALYAVCCYDPDSQEGPDYYPLLYRVGDHGVTVASTGWTDSAGWSTLANGELLVVEQVSLRTAVLPVARLADAPSLRATR